jgi:hypothetical protein
VSLLSRRQVHAALAGAAAAATWLAAAELGSKRPVRVGALFLLSSSALAGVVGMGASNRASVKAKVTEDRLNNWLQNGGHVGGDVTVAGNHTVQGTHTVMGKSSLHNDIDLNTNNMNGLQEVNSSSGPNIGFHQSVFMNNQPLWMQGGSIHANTGIL